MFILGICNEPFHDSGAALIKDGEIVAAAEEERFVRVKHAKGHPYPEKTIDLCLQCAGISLDDIDHIGFHYKPWLTYRRIVAQNALTLFRSKDSFKYSIYSAVRPVGFILDYLRKYLELKSLVNDNCRLHFIEHHTCHAASTFFVSPFEEAAILTIDNRGENVSTTLNIGKGNEIHRIEEIRSPHSLGSLYLGVTRHLGFGSGDEYKVMGLASYGKPKYVDTFWRMVHLMPKGRFKFNSCYFKFADQCYFNKRFYEIVGPPRKKSDPIEDNHADIASSLQTVTEETVLHMLNHLYEVTKIKNLCMAGGVALNCSMNGRVLEESPFKNVFVQPAAHDPGTALGSALYIYHAMLGFPRKYVMEHAYLGPDFSNEQIENTLKLSKLKYEYRRDIVRMTAKLLAEGNIIGWFQGRMEWGPRALGNRSILVDPRKANMKDKLNKYVKYREDFRPFAPSVLEERAHEYFDCKGPLPFMLFVVKVLPEKRSEIPAVTHIDGTARVHTVSKKTNPKYYSLIQEFDKLTGVPVLLNTSFNIKGEPIVLSPAEAIRCFAATGIDYLVMGDFLLQK